MAAPSLDEPDSLASLKRAREKSTSPPTVELRFIDETQRQTSSQIRRDIRSHVRKASHERQRRLNAAAKARPLDGARKLLQKKKDRAESPAHARLVPKLQQLQITVPHDLDGPSCAESSTSTEKALILRPWATSVKLGTRFDVSGTSSDIWGVEFEKADYQDEHSPLVDILLSSGESSPEPLPMDRWHFETSKTHTLPHQHAN